jgi:hypothetical protein
VSTRVAVQTGRDDVGYAVAAAIAMREQMLRCALKGVRLTVFQTVLAGERARIADPHGLGAVVATAFLMLEGTGAGFLEGLVAGHGESPR